MNTWEQTENDLLKDGFSSEEIASVRQRKMNEMFDDGFTEDEVKKSMNIASPSNDPLKQLVEDNYQKYIVNADDDVKDFFDFFDRAVMGKSTSTMTGKELNNKVSMSDAFVEGAKESVPVMQYKALHGDSVLNTDTMPPEYFDSFDRAAKMAGTMAGDLPYMIAGGVAAGAATAAAIASAPVTIPAGLAAGATVFAIGAGANALPASLRSYLVNFYEKGEVKDFSDFWERLSSVVVDTGKEGIIGGGSELVGGKVAGKVAAKGGGYLLQRGAQVGSEMATMIGMKSAIEGQVPSLQDFQDSAILVAGLAGSSYASSKLLRAYKEAGVHPKAIAERAMKDPAFREELISANDSLPAEIEAQITPIQKSISEAVDLEKPPVKQNMVELTPAEVAEKKIRDSIGSKEKSTVEKLYEDFKQSKSAKDVYEFGKKIASGPAATSAKEFYAKYVNRFHPIKEVSEKGFQGYKLISGINGVVKTFIDHGSMDFKTGKVNGESFSHIMKDIDNFVSFENYMVAKRVVELRGRGVEQIKGLSIDEANSLIKRDANKYETQSKRFYEFEDRVMKFVEDSGRFSKEDIATIKSMNKSHISLKKIIDPLDESKGGKSKDPYKKIGASDLQIKNPLISTIENVEAAIKLAETNKAKLDFIIDAESKEIVKKVKKPIKEIKISEDEVKKMFEDNGIDADPEEFSIFRSSKQALKENEIEVYNSGKSEIYEILDPIVAKAIKSFDENPYMQGVVAKSARGVTSVFKMGTTGIPDFIAQNIIVDYTTYVVKNFDINNVSKTTTASISNSFKNNLAVVKSIVNKDAGFYDYISSKASGSAWADAETALLKITEGKYNTKDFAEINSKTRNVVQSAKQFYETAQLLSEHFVRLKVFNESLQKGMSREKAAIASKDITLDFSQRGYSKALANLSAITAFQNVAIQGMDNFARFATENPKKLAINGAAILTLPTIALWLANKDDERIAETPEWEKYTYWHIATDDWQDVKDEYAMAEANSLLSLDKHDNQVRELPNGVLQINRGIIFKIKKPPVYGEIFATMPEVMLNKFFKDNPDKLDEFGKSFFKNAIPSVIPNIAIPAIEQFANKSFFTGNNIIPYTMQKTSPELQYTEYTNPSARALGKMIQAVPILGKAATDLNMTSPIILENYVRQWTGGGGMYMLQLASAITPQEAYKERDITDALKKPASALSDVPMIKRFISRHPSSGLKSITDFEKYYEKYSQLEADSAIERQRWNMENFSYLKQKQLDEFAPIKGISEAIRKQSALIHIMYKRQDLNETEKRQLIDATYYQMLGLAQQGLKMIGQFEEDNKQLSQENK